MTDGDKTSLVFLSYARVDRPRVALLAQALENAGLTLWWDTHIEGGAAFANEIEQALERSDAVIVAWSKTSVQSDWVRDEAGKGREKGRLVPVSLDGTAAPLGFRQYHVIDLSKWNGKPDTPEMTHVMRAIAAATGREPPLPRPVVQALAPSRRKLLIGGASLGIAAGAGVLAWQRGWLGSDTKPLSNSVAVMPFRNLSGDPAQSYFSDGLSEEVRSTLARNDSLRVMAQTSSAKFTDHADDAVTIARKLDVAYLLDGSVRRAGNIVRIAAELIDGQTGFSKWAQSFDRPLTDVFAVQSEIASTVAQALVVKMSGLIAVGGTTIVAAYDAYLKGRALVNLSGNEEMFRTALKYFDAAIAADPKYAAAHAIRSRALAVLAGQFAKADQLRRLYNESINAAKRAVALAPNLAEAHSALGFALFHGRLNVKLAHQPFEWSRVLGWGNADILLVFAIYCARAGRAKDATNAIQRALSLDPFNARTHRAAGSISYADRRYADAIPLLQKAIGLNPKIGNAHAYIGDALFMLGRVREAREIYFAEPHNSFGLSGLAIAEYRLGNEIAAHEAMVKLVELRGDGSLYQQALVLAQWDKTDAAFAMLDRAYEIGDSGLIYARNDPMLDPLRRDPRFSRLLKRLGFE
jgi:TolB-like protein/Tfp pilus assembly protein PilF